MSNNTCKWCGNETGDWLNECKRCTWLRLEIKDNPTLVDRIMQGYQQHDPREDDPGRVYEDERKAALDEMVAIDQEIGNL